jgi:hypothetical protein
MTLSRYLTEPAASHHNEARALLADLDHAVSRDEARVRAKALVDDDLKKYIASGVEDLLDGVHNAELKESCAAILLEAFREESASRAVAASKGAVAYNNRAPGMPKRSIGPPRLPGQPRGRGPQTAPAREVELGFKLIYSGQNFDGWSGHLRRVIPAKKGVPKGMTHYDPVPPQNIVRREGNTLVSSLGVGILSTDKLQQVTSLKFDYMIASAAGRPAAKARIPAHAVAEFSLDKPQNLGNTSACGIIEVSLLADEAGGVATLRSNRSDRATQGASTQNARQNGEWNEMEIKYDEGSIQVVLNGVEVNRLKAQRRFTARIAFSFGNVELHLANIRLH